MDPLEKLTAAFERFPGIGPRQARRFVQYLLQQNQSYRAGLADVIHKLGAEVSQCKKCFRWFPGAGALCTICSDTKRDAALLFVIEKDADIEPTERSGFKGLYFVLGGTIPLASDEPQKFIRLKELEKRLLENNLKEIILGLSATTEGDHTRGFLGERLAGSGIKLTSLGRGLSTGSELEYADPDTIGQALENRH